MTSPRATPAFAVFDGHNDVLTRLLMAGGVEAASRFMEGGPEHVDLPKARRGGLAGGLFAVWVPSPPREDGGGRARRTGRGDAPSEAMRGVGYDVPLPPPLERAQAIDVVMHEIAILERLELLGGLRICTDTSAIRRCMADSTVAAVLHLEGCEAIDPELHLLGVLYRAGLRSLGPVWSRNTIFADGVPFRFPSSPDIGGGLTDIGRRLVSRCNGLGILVDCSHLTERGFDDVAETSDAPIVATHSNAHALCAHARNLTDRMLDVIAASDGVVGLNLATAFLREDGRMLADVPLDTVRRHLDHLIDRLGEGGVALGSDFDGAVVPRAIGDAAGLPALFEHLSRHGYPDELLTRIAHGNWLDVLARTWGEPVGNASMDKGS